MLYIRLSTEFSRKLRGTNGTTVISYLCIKRVLGEQSCEMRYVVFFSLFALERIQSLSLKCVNFTMIGLFLLGWKDPSRCARSISRGMSVTSSVSLQ